MQVVDYSTYSERQLKKMLDTISKQITKAKIDEVKIKNKLKSIIQKEHFIKDALMQKWREPSQELLEAIQEVERGEVETYETLDEFKRAMNA